MEFYNLIIERVGETVIVSDSQISHRHTREIRAVPREGVAINDVGIFESINLPDLFRVERFQWNFLRIA